MVMVYSEGRIRESHPVPQGLFIDSHIAAAWCFIPYVQIKKGIMYYDLFNVRISPIEYNPYDSCLEGRIRDFQRQTGLFRKGAFAVTEGYGDDDWIGEELGEHYYGYLSWLAQGKAYLDYALEEYSEVINLSEDLNADMTVVDNIGIDRQLFILSLDVIKRCLNSQFIIRPQVNYYKMTLRSSNISPSSLQLSL